MTPNLQSAARYVHPRSGDASTAGQHEYGLEIADDSAPNYQSWISDLARPYLGKRVLEIGAGLGAMSRFLSVGVDYFAATDVSDDCLQAMETRFVNSPNIHVYRHDVNDEADPGGDGEKFDSVVLVNVLEHIYDDEAALRRLSSQLVVGGHLIVYVPALKGLYGSWDRKIGHLRRYSKPRMAQVAREAGLEVVLCRYVNLIGIPAWLAFSRFGVRRNVGGDDKGPGKELALWDRTAVPSSRFVESRVQIPIGLNVLCVARRTT